MCSLQSHPHCISFPQSHYSSGQFLDGHVHLLFMEACLGVLHCVLGWVASSCGFRGSGDLSVRLGDGSALVLKFLSNSATLLWPQHHIHLHHGLAPPDTDWGQSVFQVGGRCSVSAQLWTDMSHSRTGPLALRQ